MKSKAPSSSASSVTAAPCWVRALTITTGASWTANRAGNVSRPDIPGISTSSVITSGLSFRARSTASRPSLAAPTTAISGLALRMSVRSLRIMAESSTTRTRTGSDFVTDRLPAGGWTAARASSSDRGDSSQGLESKVSDVTSKLQNSCMILYF